MASGTSLKITYNTADGTTIHTWKYINADVPAANVKSLINTTIANATLFSRVPVSAQSAKLVTTTETPVNIS